MKSLIFGMFLLGFIAAGNSQILLEEAKVEYRPETLKVNPTTKSLVAKISEKVAGEFQQDPLSFMKTNFDSKKFIEDNRNLNLSNFEVFIQSRKGYLHAFFDNKGNLISSRQKFTNVVLPQNAQMELHRLHEGAVVRGNNYFAHSKGWDITKEYYKVKIREGNKTKNLRINKDNDRISIAGL